MDFSDWNTNLIAGQEIYNNQQPYEDPTCLLNKKRPQVLTNQYPENNRLL